MSVWSDVHGRHIEVLFHTKVLTDSKGALERKVSKGKIMNTSGTQNTLERCFASTKAFHSEGLIPMT